MKWIYLLGIAILTPILIGLLRSNRKYIIPACFWLGVTMLLVAPSMWAAPYGWPLWPSPVRGMEVSFVDAFSIALFMASPGVRVPTSIKLSYAIIWAALVVSTIVAINTIAAIFYIWEFLRTTLLFLAIARVSAAEPRAPIAIVSGLAAAVIGEAIWVPLQGSGRPGGSLGYANILGIALDLTVLPAMSLMLGSSRRMWLAVAIAAGGVCVVLGGSRASMGLFGIGIALTVVLSLMRRRTSQKFAIAGAIALLCTVAVPVGIWAAGQRSDEEIASSDFQRAAMKDAARMMIADHPLGVGANQYVVVANVGGYMGRAGVGWSGTTRRAPVHDTYYLVTAEFGFLGLIGLFSLFGSLMVLGFRNLRRPVPDETGELIPGLLAAVIVVAIHISYEFAFFDAVLHYLFATCAGLLVGIVARSKMPAKKASPSPMPRGMLSPAA